MSRPSLALLATLLLTRLVATVRAQSEPEDFVSYQTLIEEAVAEFDGARFEESRALFVRAHRLLPSARTLRGLGMAEFELRNYPECIQDLSAALTSQIRPLEGALRSQAEELLARARTFVAELRFEVIPGHAIVSLDGTVVDAMRTAFVNVGDHVIEAHADGFVEERHALSLKAGGINTVRIDLSLISPAHDVLPQRLLPPPIWQQRARGHTSSSSNAVESEIARPVSTSPSRLSRTAVAPSAETHQARGRSGAWWLTGSSGVVCAGGLVLIGLGVNAKRVVEGAVPGTDWADVESKYEQAPALLSVGIVLSVVGAFGLLSGLWWGLRRERGSDAPRKPSQMLHVQDRRH